MSNKEKRELLIAYEKHHCHPIEWEATKVETIKIIDDFLLIL